MTTIQYFIITLKTELDRVRWVKSHILAQISDICCSQLYFAIDGRKMTVQEIRWWIDNNYLKENYKHNPGAGIPFRQGQVGCALSHIRIWERILQEQIPVACILEDDAKITNDNITETLNQVVRELPADWDHCNLYHHPKFAKRLNDPTLHLQDHPLIMKAVPMWGTVGYLISQRGVKKLLRYTKPIFNTIDEMIKDLITKNLIKSYMIKVPPIDTIGHTVSNQTQPPPHLTGTTLQSTIWASYLI
jgi:glycosyl transferase family 25